MAKAPPFNRAGGRPRQRTSTTASRAGLGKTVINASCPPVVYTDGIGERLIYNSRGFHFTSNPVPPLDD